MALESRAGRRWGARTRGLRLSPPRGAPTRLGLIPLILCRFRVVGCEGVIKAPRELLELPGQLLVMLPEECRVDRRRVLLRRVLGWGLVDASLGFSIVSRLALGNPRIHSHSELFCRSCGMGWPL